jgi:hypothetical protein
MNNTLCYTPYIVKKSDVFAKMKKRVHWNETISIYAAYSCREYDRTMNKDAIEKNMVHIRNMRMKHAHRKLRIEELMTPSEMCHVFTMDDDDDDAPLSKSRNEDPLLDFLGDLYRAIGLLPERQ